MCAAVGAAPAGTKNAALAELREGGTWSARGTPLPKGTTSSFLLGVTCSSPSACVAVGSYERTSGLSFPLAEVWNGATWADQTPPYPSGAPQSQLSAVSCTSARWCMAVGAWWTAHYVPYSFADVWNGTKWSTITTPQPSDTAYSLLRAVSCTASTFCLAVGRYVDNQSVERVLVDEWSGGKWATVKAPEPAGANAAWLAGVSCTSKTGCVAVGGYSGGTKAPTGRPLAEVWNGSSWTATSLPEPSGATAGELLGISCVSARACEAAGDATGKAGNSVMVAEVWDGAKWSLQPVRAPSGSTGAALTGVSCSAVSLCVAGGAYGTTKAAPGLPLAEAWNGSKWVVEVPPK
jgi:hypothetical protein